MTDPAADFGTNGPAATARPNVTREIGGESRGSIATVRIEVRQYLDATLYDRMHQRAQLSDRQHKAAERLGYLWSQSGLEPPQTGSYGLHRHGHDATDEPDEPTGLDRFRRAMKGIPALFVLRLDAMLLGQHPGVAHLATLQAALDFLAKRWGIED